LNHLREIHTVAEFLALGRHVKDQVLQGVDFCEASLDWASYRFENVAFLGCSFAGAAAIGEIITAGGLVFPRLSGLPYEPYRSTLYSWQELMEGWSEQDDQSVDKAIYDHFSENRENLGIMEALAQRIHDHAVDDALHEEIAGQRLVGIMGGHGTRRDSADFKRAAEIARGLTRAGYLVASGGGPGIMEASNLGAWLAPYPDEALEQSLETLSQSPHYADLGFVTAAREVVARTPNGAKSLAIPTWFYGHEPSNVFATSVAKYFSNSLREDCLLAICVHGIVFCPGSAGTTQEIFQDAAQNHYATFGHISPMVFVGTERYATNTSIYAMMRELSAGKAYASMMTLTDSPAAVVEWISTHEPIKA
jgi:predicted Rossmann-fold nucleotide-binding protein